MAKKNENTEEARAAGEPKEELKAVEERAEEMQKAADEAAEQGYIGVVPDPTPNENYTVQGVTSGKPTPETDPELRAEARRMAGLDGREGSILSTNPDNGDK